MGHAAEQQPDPHEVTTNINTILAFVTKGFTSNGTNLKHITFIFLIIVHTAYQQPTDIHSDADNLSR